MRFFDRLTSAFNFGERVYDPPQIKYGHPKSSKVSITRLRSTEDLMGIRSKLEEVDVLFIDVSHARKDQLSDNIVKIKNVAGHLGAKVYGVDPRWIVVSQFEKL